MRILAMAMLSSVTFAAAAPRPSRAQTVVPIPPAASAAAPKRGAAGKGAAGAAGTGAPIRTVFLPSKNNPLVAIRLFFRIGSVDDPAGKEGLAALTSDIIGQGGTAKRTYAEVLDALYPLAAHIRVIGDVESIVFEGTVHRDNLTAFANLLVEQVLQPRFAQDDFDRNRENAVDYLTKTLRGNDDEDLGKQALASVLYAGHPYRRPAPGTAQGLAAITLDDVKKFYSTHFSRDRLIVGVAGGYPDGFAESFAAKFNALPAKAPPLPRLRAPTVKKGAEVLIVEKDARANAVSIGYPIAITRAHPDFYPLTVARSYLGEHRTFNGVLMNRLRADRGLNYGDYAYVENFIQDGWTTFPHPNIARRQQHFEIWLRPVPPQNALFALRGAVYYTRQLIREGIPQAGFESTRTFLMNYCDLWTQDVSRRLGYAIDAKLTGKDIVKELKARLPKLKKADVDRVIRKYLQMDNFSVAIVSDKAQDLRTRLAEGRPTPITYDTKGTAPEILAEDKKIEREPLPLTADSIRIVPADQMFER